MISQELINQLLDMIACLELQRLGKTKKYKEGIIWGQTVKMPNGEQVAPNHPDAKIAKYRAKLVGTTLDLDLVTTDNEPRFHQLDVQHSFVTDKILPSTTSLNSPNDLTRPHKFMLNSRGKHEMVFYLEDETSCREWISAIKLAAWEKSHLAKIYTGALIRRITKSPNELESLFKPATAAMKGRVQARFQGQTRQEEFYVVLSSHLEANKTKWMTPFSGGSSLNSLSTFSSVSPGNSVPSLQFFRNRFDLRPFATLEDIHYCAAVYPEDERRIDEAALLKVEGTLRGDNLPPKELGGKGNREIFVLLTPEGKSFGMMKWIMGISSTFKLYGRPESLAVGYEDKNSFFFGYHVAKSSELFLNFSEISQFDIDERSPGEVGKALIEQLSSKIDKLAVEIVRSEVRVYRETTDLDQDCLGEGAYGNVYKALYRNQLIAVKIMKINRRKIKKLAGEQQLPFQTEAQIWKGLNHKFIHKFIGYSWESDELFLYSELHLRGNLGQYLSTINELSQKEMVKLMFEVALGLKYLHVDKRILHGDLKGSNILFKDDGTPQISDFGLSRFEGGHVTRTHSRGQKGTIFWQSPERILGKSLKRHVDIYAFGITCWEILTKGETPYSKPEEPSEPMIAYQVLKGLRPTKPDWIPNSGTPIDKIWRLMEHCWFYDHSLEGKEDDDLERVARPEVTTICEELERIQKLL